MIPAAGRRRRGWRFPMIFASEWWRRSFWAAVAQCGRQAFRCEHRKRGALGGALQDHGADFAFRGRSPVRPYRGAARLFARLDPPHVRMGPAFEVGPDRFAAAMKIGKRFFDFQPPGRSRAGAPLNRG